MLRRICVYGRPDDWRLPLDVAAVHSARFDSLFRNTGAVRDGFAEPVDMAEMAVRGDDHATAIRDGMILGTPDEVVATLRKYQAAGVDQFCYGASFGLPYETARRSLELFITDVMPHFA